MEEAILVATLYGDWKGQRKEPITIEKVKSWMKCLMINCYGFKPKVDTIHRINLAEISWVDFGCQTDPNKYGELWLSKTNIASLRKKLWAGKIHTVKAEISGTIAEVMEWAAEKYGNNLLGPEIQLVLRDECAGNRDLISKLPNSLGIKLLYDSVFSLGGATRNLGGEICIFRANLSDEMMLLQLVYSIQDKWDRNGWFFILEP